MENIRSFFWFSGAPDAPYVLTAGEFWTPEQYIDFLNRCKRERTVLLFTANRYLEDGTPLFDTKMKVVVADFEVRDVYKRQTAYMANVSEVQVLYPQTVTYWDGI